MNRDRKKFWGKNVSICIGLYAISICPAHGQILQKCYQGQFNFRALSQRGTENGRDRRRRERSEPGDLQGRACCRAERACGIGIRDEDTPPRGNAASSGTRSASAAFCVQNTGGSGYRQDRASVIRRPRKQCFAEQRRGGGAVRRRRSLADGGGKDSAASRRRRRSKRGDMPETCCVLPWGIRAVFAAACVAARAAAKMCAPHALSLWSRSRADFESCP